ncbi:CHASE2 domain-containing protein [Leptolyngbya sp. FACHB-261]|uniref:CHASE2 domain-containing protein n=1 Tax=Leptolyngbya sp. FACHB-261 TaxID=2692806 RepID=UPI001683476C|nr:CHASE2 domain-containing protein [Leptolyngbya sp. FACHB-261]MBD2103987.1 CHASE2 domain-containing protein [Leptolyngbya sp. FACHB-261]
MGKRVILTLLKGSLEQGFPAILRIRETSASSETELQEIGHLPPAPNLSKIFNNWCSAYRQIVMPSRLKPKPSQVTNISCHHLALELSQSLNQWLNSEVWEWQKIRDRLQRHLNETDEIQVILETEDVLLRQLPWNLWDLFSAHYKKAEVALSAPQYQPLLARPSTNSNKVRILAVLGDSTGIDTQADRALLEQLPNADICFLVEPQRKALNEQLWSQKGWDLLFFAGHSSSQADRETGRIYLNQTDSLKIDELKYALERAVEGGLKIAIFNSCDGLGLARELAELQIPQVIVMREPVPDQVAQEFLKHFLEAFAQGESLYLAVRSARKRLQGLENLFPCATWLPVICQNPAELPPTWQGLCHSDVEQRKREQPISLGQFSWRRLLLTSLVITSLLTATRYVGWLQPWELWSLDQLMQRRPMEKPDPRLLIVAAAEEDLAQYASGASLTDTALAQLLDKLQQYQPRAIGLDIYRDRPVGSEGSDLAMHIQSNDSLIAICQTGEVKRGGVAPPPEIPIDRLGFSDVAVDPDFILRRQLLSINSNPLFPCQTTYSFSLLLALRYLAAQGIQHQTNSDESIQIGETVFKRLRNHTGGYQAIDDRGYQMLLNYRVAEPLAQTISFSEILTGQLDSRLADLVRDRIVLVGVTAPSVKDDFLTPISISQQDNPTTRGLLIQAQMISQILSTVLDQRPLLWAWPQWGEFLWFWICSLAGGLLAWRIRSLLWLGVANAVALVVLGSFCYVLLLINGCWVPLIPAALALMSTSGGVAYVLPKSHP